MCVCWRSRHSTTWENVFRWVTLMSRLVTFWQKRGRRRRDGRSPLKNFRRNLFLSCSSPLFLLKSIYYFIFFSFLASPGRVLSHSKRQQWWRDGRQCSIRKGQGEEELFGRHRRKKKAKNFSSPQWHSQDTTSLYVITKSCPSKTRVESVAPHKEKSHRNKWGEQAFKVTDK